MSDYTSVLASKVYSCLDNAISQCRDRRAPLPSVRPEVFADLSNMFDEYDAKNAKKKKYNEHFEQDISQLLQCTATLFFQSHDGTQSFVYVHDYLLLTWLSLRIERLIGFAQTGKEPLMQLLAATRLHFSGDDASVLSQLNLSDLVVTAVRHNRALVDNLLVLINERSVKYGLPQQRNFLLLFKWEAAPAPVTPAQCTYEAFLQLVALAIYIGIRDSVNTLEECRQERSRAVMLWNRFLELVRLLPDGFARKKVIRLLLPAMNLKLAFVPYQFPLQLARIGDGEDCILALACFKNSPGDNAEQFFREFLVNVLPYRGKVISVDDAAAWWVAAASLRDQRATQAMAQLILWNRMDVSAIRAKLPFVLQEIRKEFPEVNKRLTDLEGGFTASITIALSDSATSVQPEQLLNISDEFCTPELLERMRERMPTYIKLLTDDSVARLLDRFCAEGPEPVDRESSLAALRPFLCWLDNMNIARYSPYDSDILVRRLCSVLQCRLYGKRFARNELAHEFQLHVLVSELGKIPLEWSRLFIESVFRSFAKVEGDLWRKHGDYHPLYALLMEALAFVCVTKAVNVGIQEELCHKLAGCIPTAAPFVPLYYVYAFLHTAQHISVSNIELCNVPQVVGVRALLEPRIEKRNCETEFERYSKYIKDIEAKFREHAELYVQREVTKSGLERMVARRHQLNDVMRAWGVKVNLDPDVLHKEFRERLERLDLLVRVRRWLEGLRVLFESPLPQDEISDHTTLSEVDDIEGRVAASFNTDKRTLKTLFFFEKRNSALFKHRLQELARDARAQLKSSGLQTLVQGTTAFLTQLFEFKRVRLEQLKDVRKTTSRFNNELAQEFQAIAECLSLQATFNAAEALQAIQAAAELLELRDVLPSVAACHTQFGMFSDAEVEAVDTLCSRVTNDLFISDAPRLLGEIHAATGNLSSQQLRVFWAVHNFPDVLNFLHRTEDFDRRVDLLNGQLQGYRFGTELIDALVDVRALLRPFLKALQEGPRHTMRDLCADLARTAAPEALRERLQRIEKVHEHMSEVAMWFSGMGSTALSMETLLPFVSQVTARGIYRSSPRSLSLLVVGTATEPAREMPGPYINELIRAMRVFISDEQISPEKKAELSEFLAVHNLAEKIHATHRVLASIGHPNYQENTIELKEFKSAVLEQLRARLEDETREWNKQLAAACEAEPRLVFLDPHQLLRFTRTLAGLCQANPAPVDDAIFFKLYPFTWACFPEFVDVVVDNAPLFRASVIAAAFRSTVQANPQCEPLQLTVAVTRALADSFVPHEAACTGLSDAAAPVEAIKVCAANRMRGEQLWLALVALFEHSKIHPSLILDCMTADAAAVQRFLQRVVRFPQLTYAVCGANLLNVEARETLLRWISDKMADATEIGHIFLVFTESNGIELFSFLRPLPITEDMVTNERKSISGVPALKPATLRTKAGIAALEIFIGGHCSGRSFDIARRMRSVVAAETGRITLGIAEGFSIATLIEKLRPVLQSDTVGPVALYLNVSAYAPLDALGQALCDFVQFGVLWDRCTGQMVRATNGRIAWHLFIELAHAPPNDEECDVTSTRQSLALLPAVAHAASAIVERSTLPFEFTQEEHLSAKLLACHTSGKTDRFDLVCMSASHPEVPATPQEQEELRNLLDRCSPCRAVQKRILQLFTAKVQWLVGYAKHVCVEELLQQPGIHLPSEFFRVFLDELKASAKMPLRELPVSLSCSPRSSLVPDFGFINLAGTHPHWSSELTLDQARKHPEQLRQFVGQAFGDRPFWQIVESQGFVLTPDLGLKLVYLSECWRAKLNVIFSGNTGSGKTELLRIFAMLVNLDTGLVPDVLSDAGQFFSRSLPQHFQLRGKFSLKDLKAEIVRMCDLPAPVVAPAPAPAVPAAPAPIPAPVPPPAPPETLFKAVAASCMSFVRSEAKTFKLLVQSQLVERVTSDPRHEAQDPEELTQMLDDICTAQLRSLCYKILMHQNLTAAEFRAKVAQITETARELNELCSGKATCVCFVDECTSTQVLGLVKEVFVDHTLDGQPLPSNLMWIGAFNRNAQALLQPGAAEARAGMVIIDDTTGIAHGRELDYAVRPPPASLEPLELEFSELSPEQQEHFLESLLKLRFALGKQVGTNEQERWHLQQAVLFGQQFLANAKIHRVHMSIRDMLRAVDLYSYFMNHQAFIPHDSVTKGLWSEQEWHMHVHQCSIILALAIAYYFRMPEIGGGVELRRKFEAAFPAKKLGIPQHMRFQDIVHSAIKQLFDNTRRPPGIAETAALMQNLFCVVVCIDAKIPVIILGPPGTSKTLSFKIAVDNMKGEHSPSPFYRALAHAQPFRCQIGRSTADKELESVFENAISRQERYDSIAAKDGERNQCVVLLDEAGLADAKEAPLKVLHYLLDHPRVAVVLLTNGMLDAAKTNRAAMLVQSNPAPEDLVALAEGCIFGAKVEDPRSRAAIDGLCQAYKCVNAASPIPDLFHLRDFVYLMRYIGREQRKTGNGLCQEVLAKGLRRNFGGLNETGFQHVLQLFFDKMAKQLKAFGETWDMRQVYNPKISTLNMLRENLLERCDGDTDPNTAAFRYTMVIDPSDNEVAIGILFGLGLLRKEETVVVHLADFASDATDAARSEAVLQVKNAMALGQTVILVNTMAISSSFYDVFNRNFDVLPVGGGTQQQQAFEYYASLAVGSFSRPCLVHRNFRAIVHLPGSMLSSTPRPFLDRFERFPVSLDDVLNERLARLSLEQQENMKRLQLGTEDMIRRVHDARQCSVFFGLVPKETLSSLMLRVATKTEDVRSTMPYVPQVFHVAEDPCAEQREDPLLQSVRQLNFHLLQIARPEAIFGCGGVLPDAYLREYLLRQEHFSVMRLLERIISASEGSTAKWCIYTRSCGELMRLHSDVVLRKTLLGPDKAIDVLSLHSLPSSKACRDAVHAFAAAKGRRMLLCVVDMGVCTSDQINLLRTEVDVSLVEPSEKAVVLLFHFPPELQVLNAVPSSQAIFANGWSFSYVDSLGVSSISNDAAQQVETVKDIDARTWLAHAFGLDVAISKDAVIEAFRDTFLDYIKELCGRMPSRMVPIKRELVPHSKEFYSSFRVGMRPRANDLFAFIRQTLQRQSYIIDELLQRFSDLWCGSFLHNVVRDACLAIQQGRVTLSLLQIVQFALQRLLKPVATNLVHDLCSNVALEAVISADSHDEQKTFLRKLLRSIPIQVDSQDELLLPAINYDIRIPSYLPLFDVLSRRLALLASRITGERGIEQRAIALERMISADPLKAALDFLEKSASLMDLFKRDLVIRLQRGHEELFVPADAAAADIEATLWLDIYVRQLEQLTQGHTQSVAHLFLVASSHNQIETLQLCLQPLRALVPPPKSKDLADMPSVDQAEELEKFVLSTTVQLAYERLQLLASAAVAADNAEVMCRGVATAVGMLTPRAPLHGTLLNVLPVARDRALFDLERAMLFALQDAIQDPIAAAKALGSARDIIDEVSNVGTCSLETMLTFATRLSQSVRDMPSEVLAGLAEDLITWRLGYNASDGEHFPAQLQHDIFVVLSLAARDKHLSPHLALLCQAVPASWFLGFLSNWFRGKPEEWFKEAVLQMERLCGADEQADLSTPTCGQVSPGAFILFHLLKQHIEEATMALPQLAESFTSVANGHNITRAAWASALIGALADKISETGAVIELPENVLRSAKEAIALKNGKQALLIAIGRDARVGELLRNAMTLRALGMKELYLGDSSPAGCDFAVPSFTIDPRSPHHAVYCAVRDHIAAGSPNFVQFVADSIARCASDDAKTHIHGEIRASIAVFTYYQCFNNGQKCEFLLSKLNEIVPLLCITPAERRAFEFLANGPLDVPDDKLEPLLYVFSQQARAPGARVDLSLAHLLANILAIALGCPSDSTHLYNRAFALGTLNGTFCPGSAYSRQNWDCGFIYDPKTGALSPANSPPPILGDNVWRRLALNTTIWGAICWALILSPDEGHQAAVSNYHFLNRVQDEQLVGAVQRNEKQVVRSYVFTRTSTFFNALAQNSETVSQHIDVVHCINEILLQLWAATDNDSKPSQRKPEFRALYRTAQEAIAYEGVLSGLFDSVLGRYAQLKAAFQESAGRSAAKEQEVMKLRQQSATRLSSPFATWAFFTDVLSRQPPERQKACSVLSRFLELLDRKQIAAIRALPLLVRFYNELIDTVSGCITEEDAQRLTVPQLIEQHNAEKLQLLWPRFRERWNELRLSLKQDVCREEERDVPPLDDTTLVTEFISHADPQIGDTIFRLIHTAIAKTQGSFLDFRDNDYQDARWNPAQLVFGSAAVPGPLPSLDTQLYALIGEERSPDELRRYVLAQIRFDPQLTRAIASFDFDRIIRYILREFTAWRPSFGNTESFRRPAIFAVPARVGAAAEATQPAQQQQEELRVIVPEPIIDVMQAQQRAERFSLQPYCATVNDAKLERMLMGMDEKALNEASCFLAMLMGLLSRKADQYEAEIEFDLDPATSFEQVHRTVSNRELPQTLRQLATEPLSGLKSIAFGVHQRIRTKAFLFQGLSPSYRATLPAAQRKQLDDMAKQLLRETKEERERLHTELNALVVALMSTHKRKLKPNSRIRVVFDEELRRLEGNQPKRDLDKRHATDLVLADVLTDSFCELLKLLFVLLGDLRASLSEQQQQPEEEHAAANRMLKPHKRDSSQLYEEAVPETSGSEDIPQAPECVLLLRLLDGSKQSTVQTGIQLSRVLMRWRVDPGTVLLVREETLCEASESDTELGGSFVFVPVIEIVNITVDGKIVRAHRSAMISQVKRHFGIDATKSLCKGDAVMSDTTVLETLVQKDMPGIELHVARPAFQLPSEVPEIQGNDPNSDDNAFASMLHPGNSGTPAAFTPILSAGDLPFFVKPPAPTVPRTFSASETCVAPPISGSPSSIPASHLPTTLITPAPTTPASSVSTTSIAPVPTPPVATVPTPTPTTPASPVTTASTLSVPTTSAAPTSTPITPPAPAPTTPASPIPTTSTSPVPAADAPAPISSVVGSPSTRPSSSVPWLRLQFRLLDGKKAVYPKSVQLSLPLTKLKVAPDAVLLVREETLCEASESDTKLGGSFVFVPIGEVVSITIDGKVVRAHRSATVGQVKRHFGINATKSLCKGDAIMSDTTTLETIVQKDIPAIEFVFGPSVKLCNVLVTGRPPVSVPESATFGELLAAAAPGPDSALVLKNTGVQPPPEVPLERLKVFGDGTTIPEFDVVGVSTLIAVSVVIESRTGPATVLLANADIMLSDLAIPLGKLLPETQGMELTMPFEALADMDMSPCTVGELLSMAQEHTPGSKVVPLIAKPS